MRVSLPLSSRPEVLSQERVRSNRSHRWHRSDHPITSRTSVPATGYWPPPLPRPTGPAWSCRTRIILLPISSNLSASVHHAPLQLPFPQLSASGCLTVGTSIPRFFPRLPPTPSELVMLSTGSETAIQLGGWPAKKKTLPINYPGSLICGWYNSNLEQRGNFKEMLGVPSHPDFPLSISFFNYLLFIGMCVNASNCNNSQQRSEGFNGT